jgi:hypothetical protein
MNWSYLMRRIIGGVLLLILILAGVFFSATGLVRKINYGFGPEWECWGKSFCIKHPVKSDKSN